MFEEIKRKTQKIYSLKKFHGCFLIHIKTALFVVPLIVLGKWKISAVLQIHVHAQGT